MDFSSALPDHIIRLAFFDVGTGSGPHGWVHEKTVPYTILAQAVSGTYELGTGKERMAVSGDEFFLAPANTPLRITHNAPDSRRSMDFRYLHFQYCIYETIDIFSLYNLPPKTDKATGQRLSGWIRELLELKSQPRSILASVRRQSLLHLILHALLGVSTRSESSGDLFFPDVVPIVAFIREHMADELTIEGLLRRFPYSRSALFSMFKKVFNQTPMAYVKTVRLHEAYRLLCGTSRSVALISEQCGFKSSQHFSREFAKQFRTSPLRARKLYRQI